MNLKKLAKYGTIKDVVALMRKFGFNDKFIFDLATQAVQQALKDEPSAADKINTRYAEILTCLSKQ